MSSELDDDDDDDDDNNNNIIIIIIFIRNISHQKIYLFLIREPIPATAGSARVCNAKEREVRRTKREKGIEAERAKPPAPNLGK